jgi:integrase
MAVAKLTKRMTDTIAPKDRTLVVYDADLKGFGLRVLPSGSRAWIVEYRPHPGGRGVSKKRITIGSAATLTPEQARKRAREILAAVRLGADPSAERGALRSAVTLRKAWQRYRASHLQRKGRSDGTVAGYADHVERLLADWLDKPLILLAQDPHLVKERHDKITRKNGPYIANGAMRTLRAIYSHARRTDRSLPADNPVNVVDWNLEKRRQTGMGPKELPHWFSQLEKLSNPIRREFHLLCLLSGSRPGALSAARVEHLDFQRRVLHIPRPKGGADRAFDLPLSRPMVRSLIRAIRAGRLLYPDAAAEWLFPAASKSRHIEEHKEDRAVLGKWGNDLRQSYRTLAQAAGVAEIDAHLLMNHSLPGVNAGYMTKGKLLSHLRAQQERISAFILSASKAKTKLKEKKLGDRRGGWPDASE